MAEVLSGSLSTNNYSTQSSGTIGLKLTWTATQSIANNTSTIKWTLVSKGSMSSGTWVTCYGVEVKINGTKVLNTTSSFHMYGDGKYKKSGTITVAHNASGGKTVAMSVKGKIYQNSWNCTDDDTFTLKTINRYALISSATDFTNDSFPTIVYTNPAGIALTTGLKARVMWNDRANYSSWVILNDEGGTYTFDATTLTPANINSMLALCPDENHLSVEINLRSTMDGVDYNDYRTVEMNVVNASPIFSDIPSYVDARPAIAGHNQVIVQKQSKLRIYHGTASAQKGASLPNNPYTLNFNGVNYGFVGDYIEFDKPDLAGVYRATISVTDTRGNVTSAFIEVSILNWSEPTGDYLLARRNSFESICDLEVTGHIASVDNYNTMLITEKHRIVGTEQWSASTTLVSGSATTVTLANTSEWEVLISITDLFHTTDKRLTVGKGIPMMLFDVHRNSISVAGIPDEDNVLYLGENYPLKADGIKFPHRHSSTEKKVGFWINNEPIYERTVSLSSAQSIPSNAWTDLETLAYDIQILGLVGFYTSNAGNLVYNNLIGQFVNSSKKVQVLNTRSSAITIDTFTIQYIKIT